MTTKEAIEIGKADGVLRQAKELVEQAYDLICRSPTASKHLTFDCTIGWKSATWNKLNNEYAVENPLSTEIYHLRAFDYFGLRCGADISLDGMTQGSGS
jgi:hypothetical protein